MKGYMRVALLMLIVSLNFIILLFCLEESYNLNVV